MKVLRNWWWEEKNANDCGNAQSLKQVLYFMYQWVRVGTSPNINPTLNPNHSLNPKPNPNT